MSTSSWLVTLPPNPTRRQERDARRKAAVLLGVSTLRGLTQVPTEEGFMVYAPGADEDGESVEIRYL